MPLGGELDGYVFYFTSEKLRKYKIDEKKKQIRKQTT